MKNLRYYILPAVALVTMGLASCNDDDPYFDDDLQSVPMTVKKVYLEDYKSSVPDREVEFARLGQMLRLEGEGFYGVKKIYINGYDTYFNRAYVTDNSLIVSINSKTPVSDCDPEVRNTIRLVKDDTELIYSFLIRNGYSVIERVSNTLPQPGETVTVYGSYLHETSKITLPGGVTVTEGIVNDEDGEWYSFTMPAGVTEGGAIVSESPNGVTESPAYFNETRGMILNFDGLGAQGYWSWKENGSMINNEDLVDDPLASGRGKVFQVVPDRLLTDGIASGKPRATECWTAGNDDPSDDWSRMTSFIPAETPLSEIALQFDILCPEPWSGTGYIQICQINNYNFAGIGSDDDNSKGMTYMFVPWMSNGRDGGEIVPFSTPEWITVTIPYVKFAKYAALQADTEAQNPTFQMVIDDRNAATYRNFGMGFVNTDFDYTDAAGTAASLVSTAFNGPKIYIDNWRIVPYSFFEPSDYEEPEDDK